MAGMTLSLLMHLSKIILANVSNFSYHGSGKSDSWGLGESNINLKLSEFCIKSSKIPLNTCNSFMPNIVRYVSGHVFSEIQSVGF